MTKQTRDVMDRLHRALFRTRYSAPPSVSPPTETLKAVVKHYVQPSLVVMSYETERDIMIADYGNFSGILTQFDKTYPRRVFGVRIAYDNTLQPGEFIVAQVLDG